MTEADYREIAVAARAVQGVMGVLIQYAKKDHELRDEVNHANSIINTVADEATLRGALASNADWRQEAAERASLP